MSTKTTKTTVMKTGRKPATKTVTTVTAPKKKIVRAPKVKTEKVAAGSTYFEAVIDPYHAARAWHLPDDFGGATAIFKQISTFDIPLTTANADDEVVILQNLRPDSGVWIFSPVPVVVDNAVALQIYPDVHQKRCRFLRTPVDHEDLQSMQEHALRMVAMRKLVKGRRRLDDGTLISNSLATPTMQAIKLWPQLIGGTLAGNCYWTSANLDAGPLYADIDPTVTTKHYYPRWANNNNNVVAVDEFGIPVSVHDVTTPSGIATAAFNTNVPNGGTYTCRVGFTRSAANVSSCTCTLRKVVDDSVVGVSPANH
jgi:hypothetical protein